ncbi:MAG: 1-acyl-sn-glycerol-3-phosphate acyltransferase, partial [Acidobacteriota bacterium]
NQLLRGQVREWLAEKLEGRVQRSGPAASGTQREAALLEELSRLSGLPRDEITAESDLYTDLGLDSLMAIELLLFLENQYGLSLADRRAALMHTVGELVQELEKLESGQDTSRRRRGSAVRSALPLEQRPVADRMCLGLTISSLRMFYRHYMDLQLHGTEVLSRHKPFIIAANHSSHLDFGAVMAAFRSATDSRKAKQLHIVGARDYFFDTPVKSWFYSSFLNIIPIEREETSLGGLRLVRSILSTGEPVLIFPEGTRSISGRLQDFKPGLGLMALELDVPIIPVYIHGTFQSMPKGKRFPSRGRVDVYFGQPILMDPYRSNGGRSLNDAYRRIAADVQQAVADLAQEAGASA